MVEGSEVVDLGFKVLGDFGFRIQVSGFGFRDSGVGIRVSGFGFRDSGFQIQVSGFGFQDLRFRFRDSGFRFRALVFGFRDSGVRACGPLVHHAPHHLHRGRGMRAENRCTVVGEERERERERGV